MYTFFSRYVIGKWDLESGVEYGWLTSLGQWQRIFQKKENIPNVDTSLTCSRKSLKDCKNGKCKMSQEIIFFSQKLSAANKTGQPFLLYGNSTVGLEVRQSEIGDKIIKIFFYNVSSSQTGGGRTVDLHDVHHGPLLLHDLHDLHRIWQRGC